MRERTCWLRYCVLVLAMVLCAALGCKPDDGGNGDNGTGGNGTGDDPSCVVALFDDFSGSLTDNWIPGRAANADDGIHDVSIVDGELAWAQAWDYIESKASFGNNLTIEFDYRAGPSSVQYGEFWVELVALTDAGHGTAGIYRGQYGTQNYHAVNVGRAPSPSDYNVVDTVLDPPYLETFEPGSPRQGKITFAYADRQVRMQFENQDGEILETGWVDTGDFTQTKIRIWGMSNRFIDNVKVCAAVVDGPDEQGPSHYELVKIVDTESTPFFHLDELPTLNDSGTVAFWADGDENRGNDGIYTGDGGEPTTILHVTEANMQDIWGYKSINSSGAVAVQLQYLQNNTTIEVRQGDTRTEVFSRDRHDGVNEISQVADPQLNDNGLVSFWKETWSPAGSRYGIYAGNGGALTTIVDDTEGPEFYRFSQATSINNSGDVAYAAKADGGEYTLYKSDGVTRTLIAAPNGQFQEVGGSDGICAINNSGDVVFFGTGMDGSWGWTGMFAGNGGLVEEIVLAKMDDSTPFMFVTHVARNDSGEIAFTGLHSGLLSGNGLYTGNDPVTGKVLESGDVLDGKEVASVSIGRHCINNSGQIVFFAGFTDGSQAIYRADPL
jgi:hypothetical protein